MFSMASYIKELKRDIIKDWPCLLDLAYSLVTKHEKLYAIRKSLIVEGKAKPKIVNVVKNCKRHLFNVCFSSAFGSLDRIPLSMLRKYYAQSRQQEKRALRAGQSKLCAHKFDRFTFQSVMGGPSTWAKEENCFYSPPLSKFVHNKECRPLDHGQDNRLRATRSNLIIPLVQKPSRFFAA